MYVTAATDGDYSTTATYDFVTVKYVSPPEILVQPASQTNNTMSTATFRVAAAGSGPLNYQWRRNGTNLFDGANVSGANSEALRLDDLRLTDATTYDVVVTNAFGSVTSSTANLSVVIPSPIALSSTLSSAGAFSLSFANTPGADFTALATTNLALPLSNWTVLGNVAEILTGQFQFVDSQATNWPQRFYRVRAN